MADPVSLVLGVAAFTFQAVQSSKALLELAGDIRGAPGDIKAIYNEVYAFYHVMFSLNKVLKDENVQTTISGNKTLMETVESLAKPINNCQEILGQLSVKLKRLHNSRLDSHSVQSSFVGVRWSLFSKNETSKLRQTLEAEKLSIIVALNTITL